MIATRYAVGDLVVAPNGAGRIEDVFLGPITESPVYVVDGTGWCAR